MMIYKTLQKYMKEKTPKLFSPHVVFLWNE
jgi:hypothetical protein